MLKKQRIYNNFLLLFVLSLFLSCVSLYYYQSKSKIGDYSVEIVSPDGKIVQPLTKNQTISINGQKGKVMVQIQNKGVRVIDSNCPDQICMKAGTISKQGPMIICVPNRVVIQIISRRIKLLTTY